MPEGVELRVSCDSLQKIVSKSIVSIELGKGRWKSLSQIKGCSDLLSLLKQGQQQICSIRVHGKQMFWEIGQQNKIYMNCSYGMTGGWFFQPDKYTALILILDDSSSIHFNDVRHFGNVAFIDKHAADLKLCNLGWDPLIEDFRDPGVNLMVKIQKNQNKEICQVLMDQSIFSGVGNYIKAEALYRSQIHPETKTKFISEDQLQHLFSSIAAVMSESYRAHGNTLRDFKSPDGQAGAFSFELQCYSRQKDPAGRQIISQTTSDGRTSWICPQIQKIQTS